MLTWMTFSADSYIGKVHVTVVTVTTHMAGLEDENGGIEHVYSDQSEPVLTPVFPAP
jgi:hypothetical protein